MTEMSYHPAVAPDAAAIAEVIEEVVAGPNPVGFERPL